MNMSRIQKTFLSVMSDFGPLVTFFIFESLWGIKAAIIAGVVVAGIEVVVSFFAKKALSSFFIFSTILTVLFGCLDLYSKEPFFIRFEAVFTNIFTGMFFMATLFKGKPLIQEFHEKTMEDPSLISKEGISYLRFLTWAWVIYFFVKALVYLWFAFEFSFVEGLALRALIGKISLLAMIFGERIFRKQILAFLSWVGFFKDSQQ